MPRWKRCGRRIGITPVHFSSPAMPKRNKIRLTQTLSARSKGGLSEKKERGRKKNRPFSAREARTSRRSSAKVFRLRIQGRPEKKKRRGEYSDWSPSLLHSCKSAGKGDGVQREKNPIGGKRTPHQGVPAKGGGKKTRS